MTHCSNCGAKLKPNMIFDLGDIVYLLIAIPMIISIWVILSVLCF